MRELVHLGESIKEEKVIKKGKRVVSDRTLLKKKKKEKKSLFNCATYWELRSGSVGNITVKKRK